MEESALGLTFSFVQFSDWLFYYLKAVWDFVFSLQVETAVLSSVVITRYNDRTYRVDDMAWDMNPGKPWNDVGETFVQYYKRKYDMDIKNMTQPLLVSRLKVRRNSNTCCDS